MCILATGGAGRKSRPGAQNSCARGSALYRSLAIGLVLCSWLLCSGRARGDVGIVLNESLDTSVARITGSGHSAVYLSRICPESPVKLRLCGPHEQGSVMSNYTTLGEDEPFEWNIVPLSVFVYGVADPESRPLFTSWKIKAALEENYRDTVLSGYCASHSCQTSGKAEWREMVSASSERTLYILIVSTTVEQDRALIEKFNDAPNLNHFNGVTRNCADFTRNLINTYFPHATHREILNDFGITTPKAVARSFAHYAHGRPETEYRVLHFAQLPGPIKRSTECRNGTEQLYHSKKLLVPMAFFAWHELPVAVGSYVLTGRFNPQHEFESHATVRQVGLGHEIELAKASDNPDEAQVSDLEAAKQQERVRVVGSEKEWESFREQFDSLVAEAVDDHILASPDSLPRALKDLSENGRPYVDERGNLWLEVQQNGKTSQVGLSANNLLAPGSDRAIAYELMLAHVAEALKSPAHQRENMPEFIEAWNLMQQARPDDYERASLAVGR
jgi:hypothetical protein